MTYKINPIVERIKSPIILHLDSASEPEHHFSNGKELADIYFDKQYLIDSISVINDAIAITVIEKKYTGPSNWIGEEKVSFF